MNALIRRFVDGAWGATGGSFAVERLRGDASNRVYHRVSTQRGRAPSFIVMQLPADAKASEEASSGVAPPAELPFVNVARYLRRAGVPVPEVYEHDEAKGLLFIEDLGDALLEAKFAATGEGGVRAHYRRAIDLIVRMQAFAARDPDVACIAFSRRFDAPLLRFELDHFIEWGLAARTGRALSPDDEAVVSRGFDRIVGEILSADQAFVHRDFQSRNLIIQGDLLRVIDFQDALIGSYVYDLVALLRDSYVVLSRDFVDDMIAYFCERRRCDVAATRRAFQIQTLQRKLKDAGRFVFIDRVKKNPSFLPSIAPSLAYVRDAFLALPEFGGLHAVLARYTPEIAP